MQQLTIPIIPIEQLFRKTYSFKLVRHRNIANTGVHYVTYINEDDYILSLMRSALDILDITNEQWLSI